MIHAVTLQLPLESIIGGKGVCKESAHTHSQSLDKMNYRESKRSHTIWWDLKKFHSTVYIDTRQISLLLLVTRKCTDETYAI